MSRRIPVNRPVAIAVARPMRKPMTTAFVAAMAVGAFFVSPFLGLGVVGLALWQSLDR
jgi:hypothetical protein